MRSATAHSLDRHLPLQTLARRPGRVCVGPAASRTASHPGPRRIRRARSALEERLRRVEDVNARLLEQLKSDRQSRTVVPRRSIVQRVGGSLPRTPAPGGRAASRRRFGGRAGQAGEYDRAQLASRAARRGGPVLGHARAPADGPARRRVPARLRRRRVRPPLPRPRSDRLQALHPQRPHLRQERALHPPCAGLSRRPADPVLGIRGLAPAQPRRRPGTCSTATSTSTRPRRSRSSSAGMLVPYSYDWFDHLEQYFIAPERALFPLNFGLSRQAGLMAWGTAWDDRLDWAFGGFNGHLTGLADNNPNQEAVGYFNAPAVPRLRSVPGLAVPQCRGLGRPRRGRAERGPSAVADLGAGRRERRGHHRRLGGLPPLQRGRRSTRATACSARSTRPTTTAASRSSRNGTSASSR